MTTLQLSRLEAIHARQFLFLWRLEIPGTRNTIIPQRLARNYAARHPWLAPPAHPAFYPRNMTSRHPHRNHCHSALLRRGFSSAPDTTARSLNRDLGADRRYHQNFSHVAPAFTSGHVHFQPTPSSTCGPEPPPQTPARALLGLHARNLLTLLGFQTSSTVTGCLQIPKLHLHHGSSGHPYPCRHT